MYGKDSPIGFPAYSVFGLGPFAATTCTLPLLPSARRQVVQVPVAGMQKCQGQACPRAGGRPVQVPEPGLPSIVTSVRDMLVTMYATSIVTTYV